MKKFSFGLFLLFASTMLPAMASAETRPLEKAEIPFSFYADNIQMPAGSYTIEVSDDQRELLLRNEDGSANAFVLDFPGDSSPATASIRFDKVGETYFLRAAIDGDQELDVAKPKIEKNLARKSTVAQIELPTSGN